MSKRTDPAPPTPPGPPQATTTECCAIVARNLVNEHFKESSKIDTEGLRILRALTARLSAATDAESAFTDFVDLVEDASAVSAFELQASGILQALVRFLSGKGLASDKQKLARLHSSAARLMSRKGGMTEGALSEEYSVVAVAKKLVSVLETMDEFELKMIPQPRFSPSAFSRSRSVNFGSMTQYHQALYALTQPLKLTLRAAPGSKLRDCTASTVLVEPLAKLSAVGDFVAARTRPQDAGRGAGGASTSGGIGSGRGSGSGKAGRTAAASAATAAAPAAATGGVAATVALRKQRTSGGGSGRLAAAGVAQPAGDADAPVVPAAARRGAAQARRAAAEAAEDENLEQGASEQEARDVQALREAFADAQQDEDDVAQMHVRARLAIPHDSFCAHIGVSQHTARSTHPLSCMARMLTHSFLTVKK